MISSFRNFAKTKFAGILVFVMIIPFVFWGMGSMFSSGNTNTIAKVDNISISTQEFLDHINQSGIAQETIRENLDNNIIEELLSTLISSTLLNLEIENYDLTVSQQTLLKKIKKNKNFQDQNGIFERLKYEKFLLENNQSAPQFEQRLKNRELQKSLFDYIGSGTVSPKFLIDKLYMEENTKLEIDYISLKNFYKKKELFTDDELKKFLEDNKDQLKIEYLDFNYVILNPINLIGVDEFNQSFFDKIDQIEIDIANGIEFENIIENLNITPTKVENFKFTQDKNIIEKKIFELRNVNLDIFENEDDFILYIIKNRNEKTPDLTDNQTKNEILELIFQKSKFEYNRELLNKIQSKNFNNKDFISFGANNIETTILNSIKDNKKFDINAVELLYSLPLNSFTLINDEKNNIYLAQIKNTQNRDIGDSKDQINEYSVKHNSNIKNSMLRSYDLYLNNRYKVVLNQRTIERVKNFFQ